MRKYKGAISLFMVVILLTSFIFGGVFIDASRVVVAKSKVRNATNSALRSAMSYYDKDLVGSYGLYAFDKTKADANFEKYFRANMIVKDDNINMFEYKIVRADARAELPIGNDEEFNRQIIEYSKYRAPVSTLMVLIDKISGALTSLTDRNNKISGAADSTQDFKDEFKRVGNQIESGLRDVKKNIKTNVKNSLKKKISENPADFANDVIAKIDSEYEAIDTAVTKAYDDANYLKKETDDYVNDIRKKEREMATDNSAADGDGVTSFATATDNKDPLDTQAYKQVDQNGTVRSDISAYKTEVDALKGQIKTAVTELQAWYNNKIAKENAISAQEIVVKEKKEIYDSKKSLVDSLATNNTRYNNAKSSVEKNKKSLKTKEEELEKLLEDEIIPFVDIITEEYKKVVLSEDAEDIQKREDFEENYKNLADVFKKIKEIAEIEKKIAEQEKIISDNKSLVDKYNTYVTERNAAEIVYNTENGNLTQLKNELSAIKKDIENKTNYIDELLSNVEEVEAPNPSELEESDIAKNSVMNYITQKIDDIKKKFNGFKDQLTGKMSSYSPDEQNADVMGKGGAIKKILGVTKYLTDALSVLTNAEKLRDNAYTVDYIMDHCTYFTSPTARDTAFKRAEVEYIIFGFDTQIPNLIASVTAIAAFRFAINAIDYAFTAPGELIAKIIYGLGRGAARTGLDLWEMLVTKPDEGIPVCPSFKHLKLTYSDHMRLLLFIKFDAMQEKLKNVMKTNLAKSDVVFENLYTRMYADVEVEVNLLVLPIFVGKFKGANFRNGNYIIKFADSVDSPGIMLGY